MDTIAFLRALREALALIRHPRFYLTERGFQGQLISELNARLCRYLPPGTGIIVEQEYQKHSALHGMSIRPDLIVHIPFDSLCHDDRGKNNFVAIELKLKAGPKKSKQDFENLALLSHQLHYKLCIFININHSKPHSSHAPDSLRGKLYCFATRLDGDDVRIVEAAI